MPSIEELQLLNYSLAEKNVTPLRELGRDHFPIHAATYDFIINFSMQFGETPTVETVLNRFETFEIVEVENIEAVKTSLREDFLHGSFRPIIVKAAQMLGERKSVEALQMIRNEANASLRQIGATRKGYSYVGEAENRLAHYDKIHGLADVLGVPTGFSRLDKITNGLQGTHESSVETDYFLVFAPTNMGKSLITSFMVQAGWNGTSANHYPAYFALEQNAQEIAHNWDNVLGNLSRIGLSRGGLSNEDRDRYADYIDRLRQKTKDIMIYDMSTFGGKLPTVDDVRSLLETEGHTFFALDQLSKMSASRTLSRGDLRQQLFIVSQETRSMILDTGVPGYVIAQANREAARKVKKDTTNKVDGEDIGEAYAILQDATKGMSVVKIDDNTFRITVVKMRDNSSGQSILVRYNFDTGLVFELNEEVGEMYF